MTYPKWDSKGISTFFYFFIFTYVNIKNSVRHRTQYHLCPSGYPESCRVQSSQTYCEISWTSQGKYQEIWSRRSNNREQSSRSDEYRDWRSLQAEDCKRTWYSWSSCYIPHPYSWTRERIESSFESKYLRVGLRNSQRFRYVFPSWCGIRKCGTLFYLGRYARSRRGWIRCGKGTR